MGGSTQNMLAQEIFYILNVLLELHTVLYRYNCLEQRCDILGMSEGEKIYLVVPQELTN